MSITESTPKRLVLVAGSTTLTLDKDARRASLQRKLAFWKLKPVEAALEDIVSVTVDKAVDRTSGVEMYSTMLVTRAGAGWALSATTRIRPRRMRPRSEASWSCSRKRASAAPPSRNGLPMPGSNHTDCAAAAATCGDCRRLPIGRIGG